MPTAARVVLMICDGHRADFLRPDLCPSLCSLARKGRRYVNHRGIFPSVTRTSSASIATGCHPGVHGLHGNTMALPEGDGYAVHDVGAPEFIPAMRAALGRSLAVPTLAERLKDHGGSIVFSNVSAGAAYFQDPDGHGFVYHRSGSYGPGLVEVEDGLRVDAAGDREMTARFCEEVLLRRRPPHAVLWLANPDHTMHGTMLGSTEHLESIAAMDACVAQTAAAVARLEAEGESVLFLIGSDHGQQTTRRVIPIERELYRAGFKSALHSPEIVVAAQGTSALVYLAASVPEDQAAALSHWLGAQDWCGSLYAGEALRDVGLAPADGLRIALSMASDDGPNDQGVPGLSDVAVRFDESEAEVGVGHHGGLGTYEQRPFLIALGADVRANSIETRPTSLLDIAPTALRKLGLPYADMQGQPLTLDPYEPAAIARVA